MEKKQISTKQIFTIFIIMIIPSITTILPSLSSAYSKHASASSAVLSIIPFVVLIYVLNVIFKNQKYKSLIDFFEDVFGKVISKVLLIVYLIWMFILCGISIRYFGERFVSTIFPGVSIELIIAALLIIVIIISRKNIEYFARTIEIIFMIFVVFILAIFLIRVPQIDIGNIYPITTQDTGLVISGIYPIISITCYITYLFFLGDKFLNKKDLLKEGKKSGIIVTCISIFTILGTIGVFGYNATKRFSFAYFKALKSSDILPTIQGFEDILVSGWVIADFVLICIIVFILTKLIKSLFKLESRKTSITPLMFCLFIFSLFLAKNKFELEKFVEVVSMNMNIALCIGVPFIATVVGKLRKKI